jgi:hypothetical protein
LTGDCKVSKSAQVPGLPFEESFEQKPGCWGSRCHSCPKLTQKRFFGLTRKVDFVAWPPNTAKITHDLLKANQKDHRSKEIWPPSSKDCNPLDYFMWSEVEREVNKQPHNTLASLKAMISDVMAKLDRDVVIHVCKRFRSCIEADMEATGVFIK